MNFGNRTIALIFLTAALILAGSIGFTYHVGVQALQANRKVTEQTRLLRQLERVLQFLIDAETAQRGYLLTGESRYLPPYTNSLFRLEPQLEILRTLTGGGEIDPARLETLAELITNRVGVLDQGIEIRRTQGAEAGTAFIREGVGFEETSQIRSEFQDIRRLEEIELNKSISTASSATTLRSLTFLITGLLNLAFLVWAWRRIETEMEMRHAAAQEVGRQKELLATTLASIGDAVIVTDAEGRVTFMNREAEHLTGWDTYMALGQLLPQVFHILNEKTRLPVENPVEKVLQHGQALGLANHTILIARDGRETPIDDSAAPIRDSIGNLFGVVLVFRDFSKHKEAEASLAQAQARLQEHAITLERTVEERTAKLREMVRDLEHVSYSIVHDMRAPLRAMQGFAGILESDADELSEEQRADFCRRIMIAANRLDRLITDTLAYNRAVLQERPMQRVSISKLVRELLDTYPNLHHDHAEIRVESDGAHVIGNEAFLTQCFSNLLGNAVKFVEPGTRPRILVRFDNKPSTVRVWVEDNGIGISKDGQSRLFGMFQRLNQAYEGTGAGLAIVRKLAERMGGQVGVESEPGQGSRFWIELRRAPDGEG